MIMKKPIVGIVMGSDSDLPTMQEAAEILDRFGIPYEMKITSAHRTPNFMAKYSSTAHERGIKVIIAGAGGAAHLPGMSAAHTPIPVIGIPIRTKSLDGLDSLLSIAQMPGGVPVATVAIGGGKNAGLLAVQILGVNDNRLVKKMIGYKKRMEKESLSKNKRIRK
jgi:5-(carboxyamino)imidazole ribonucleotide mutase